MGWTARHCVGAPGFTYTPGVANRLIGEFLDDYVYAIATNDYAAAVWNDARFAPNCPALDAWRASLQGGPPAPRPRPNVDCPTMFGNTDIFGGSWPDPTR